MEILIYQAENGNVPLLMWLKKQNQDVQEKSYALIEKLQEKGHQLRMPHSKPLGEGIFELRFRVRKVRYRILYCYVGKDEAILINGFTKKSDIEPGEIEKARKCRDNFNINPKSHIYNA